MMSACPFMRNELHLKHVNRWHDKQQNYKRILTIVSVNLRILFLLINATEKDDRIETTPRSKSSNNLKV